MKSQSRPKLLATISAQAAKQEPIRYAPGDAVEAPEQTERCTVKGVGIKGSRVFLAWFSAVSFMYARGSDWLQESKCKFSHRVLDRHPCISIRLHGYTFFREIPV